MTDFTPSSQAHPCPVCGRNKDGDCRISENGELVLCRIGTTFSPPITEDGATFTDATGREWGCDGPISDGRCICFHLKKSNTLRADNATRGEFTHTRPTRKAASPNTTTPITSCHQGTGAMANSTTRRTAISQPTATDGTPPLPIAAAIALARLPEPGELPPASLPNGYVVTYSATQFTEQVVDADGNKASKPRHQPKPHNTVLNAGPDHWPLYGEHNAITYGRGQWVLELEGPKCAMWAEAGGVVAISHPGHALAPDAVLRRYQDLKTAGIAGVVYVADNDTTGNEKAKKHQAAATDAGLPFLLLPASSIWPNKLPVGGSIDDAPGTPTDRIAAIQQAIPKAAQKHNDQIGDETDDEEEPRLTYSELLAAALEAIRRSDRDTEMELRAELAIRFRRDHQQIDAALFRLLTQQSIGETAATRPLQAGLDLEQIDGMDSLLDGFLVANDQALIYGKAGSGKTLACLAAGFAVIDGTGFLDHDSSPQKGKVLFIASDSGAPPLKAALCDLGLAEHPAVKPGPDQRFFVWAHDHGQGMPAWTASISDWVRLLEFVTTQKIDLVFIDSAKAVCSQADPVVSYASNEAVSAMLTFVKSVICPHTSVVWISHDGTEKGAHAGAKAWAEIPSIVHRIEQVPDRPSERSWTVVKNRMGSTRSFNYTLTPDGQLQACQGVPVIQNASDAVVQVLTEAYQRGIPTVSRQGLVDEIGRRWSYAKKTVDNTIQRLARKSRPPICRVGTPVGHYKLSPRMTEELSRQASQSTDTPTPLKASTQIGEGQGKNPVVERDLVSTRPFPTGYSVGTRQFPMSTQGENDGYSVDPSEEKASEAIPTQRGSHRVRAREEEGVRSSEAGEAAADSWQPVTFTTYRGDQTPDDLQPGDRVRPPSGGVEHTLQSPTSNSSWQDTAGQIVPIAPGWQFRRPQQLHHHQQEAAA